MKLRESPLMVVPAITVVLGVAAMTIGTGSGQLVAARVWGGPTDSQGPAAVRIECVRRASGVDDRVPLTDLDVDIGGVKQRVSCGTDGSVDLDIETNGAPLPVRITRNGAVLAEGRVNVSRAKWLARAVQMPSRLAASGTGTIRGYLEGGTAPMERWTTLLLEVPPELARDGALTLTGSSAEVTKPKLTPRGFTAQVEPTFLTATIRAEGPGVVWEAQLPVQPASFVAEDVTMEGGRLRATVRSLPARERVYARIADDRGRIAASSVALASDGRGGTFGALDMPLPVLTGPAFLVLGADPDASGSATASIPIPKGDITREARVVPDVRWIDGLGPVRAADVARWRKRARAVGMLVAAAALLETMLLLERGRAARARLRAHLAAFDDRPEIEAVEQSGGGFAIALGVAAVLFGFAVIGVLFLARMG